MQSSIMSSLYESNNKLVPMYSLLYKIFICVSDIIEWGYQSTGIVFDELHHIFIKRGAA